MQFRPCEWVGNFCHSCGDAYRRTYIIRVHGSCPWSTLKSAGMHSPRGHDTVQAGACGVLVSARVACPQRLQAARYVRRERRFRVSILLLVLLLLVLLWGLVIRGRGVESPAVACHVQGGNGSQSCQPRLLRVAAGGQRMAYATCQVATCHSQNLGAHPHRCARTRSPAANPTHYMCTGSSCLPSRMLSSVLHVPADAHQRAILRKPASAARNRLRND